VDSIDRCQDTCRAGCEFTAGEATQVIRLSQPCAQRFETFGYLRAACEGLAAGAIKQWLRRDCTVREGYALIARMTAPFVDILKELAVNCLQMGCIESGGNAGIKEMFGVARDHSSDLEGFELVMRMRAEFVLDSFAVGKGVVRHGAASPQAVPLFQALDNGRHIDVALNETIEDRLALCGQEEAFQSGVRTRVRNRLPSAVDFGEAERGAGAGHKVIHDCLIPPSC